MPPVLWPLTSRFDIDPTTVLDTFAPRCFCGPGLIAGWVWSRERRAAHLPRLIGISHADHDDSGSGGVR